MNDNTLSYAGFTIGPIYDVMKHARKTREMWFGSYFFSWYMEVLERELQKNKKIEFLTPFIDNKENDRRAGLYPDRFVLESSLSPEEIRNTIKTANEKALKHFIQIINNLGSLPAITFFKKKEIGNILREYLQTNMVVLPAEKIAGKNVIETFWDYLDATEEHRHFKLGKSEKTCERCHTLLSVATAKVMDNNKKKDFDLCPLCLLKLFTLEVVDVQNKISGWHRYPSTGEISAVELVEPFRKNDGTYQDELQNYFDKHDEIEFDDIEFRQIVNKEIKPYHKYIAILDADGDKIGELAKKVKDPTAFSEMLFNFGKESYEICSDYSRSGKGIGEPIYIGGDDVLAFLPVAYRKSDKDITTIIDLAMDLNKAFKVQMKSTEVGFSIGISIAYYKHPLAVTLNKSREMLKIAKAQDGKDTLAIHLKKHSGNDAQVVFSFKESERLKEFNGLLKAILLSEEDLMGSIHYNLLRFKNLLIQIETKEQLTNFFDNNFSDQKKAGYTGIDHVQNMFEMALGLNSVAIPANSREKAVNEVLDQLWFIKFLVGKEEE